jgi:gluconolactonase
MQRSLASLLIPIALAVAALFMPDAPGVRADMLSAEKPRMIRLDARLDALLPPDAGVEKIADGFTWVEGPVWVRRGGYLLFSEIPANRVWKWKAGEGTSVFLEPSGYTGPAPFAGREPGSNGLTLDAQGRLVLAEHGDRRVARLERDGRKTTLVDRYQGPEGSGRINSPNDVVFDSKGNLYFTDPAFGLPKAFDDPGKELPFQGVYRLTPSDELTLLISDIKAPNGIAFSPDEKKLYVTNVSPGHPAWHVYDFNGSTPANGRVFVDAEPFAGNGTGGPDGLKVDANGNLFASGPGGLYIFASDGTLLGRIHFGKAVSNCAWGEDGSVLYITASDAVYRVRLRTKGRVLSVGGHGFSRADSAAKVNWGFSP